MGSLSQLWLLRRNPLRKKLMRKPDLYLKGYLRRWWLIPRNKYFNIYLHCFEGSDDDRALHDHPWWSLSFKLWGSLREHLVGCKQRDIISLLPYVRTPKTLHRMELRSKNAWTLFITGPRLRDWGFKTEGSSWIDHITYLQIFGDRN